MKQLSPAEISRAIGRMLEAGPDRSNDAEVSRYWQLLTDVSFAMARFAGVSNRQVLSSYRTFDIEIGAGAENLEPYTDTPSRLRAEAQALLTEAQAVDHLFPFVLHHAQERSNTAYLAWAPSEPSHDQAASVLVHEYVREDHDLSICGPIALSEIIGTDQRLVIGGESENARDHERSTEQLKAKYGDELFPFVLHHAQQHSNPIALSEISENARDHEHSTEQLKAKYGDELFPFVLHHAQQHPNPIALSEITGTDQCLVIGGEGENARVQAAPSTFDDSQAMQEGWLITDGPTPQLQKLDEDQVFKYDVSAWVFVYQQAQGGSEYHQKALEHMQQHNPGEYNAIMAHGAEAVDALRDDPSDDEVAAPTC